MWQFEHCPVSPVWFIRAGLNAVKFVWHVSHCAVVGMWVVVLPSAVVPLWQSAQRPVAVAS